MAAALTPIFALLLSVAILIMGHGLQQTLLPIRAGIEDFSTLDIGILGASYFFGFLAGCLTGSLAVRRAGHIRAFAAMVSIASTVALVHVLIEEPIVWWLLRAVTGYCFATLYMIIESWLNERSTNDNRGFVFSIYVIITLTVMTLGQLMITLADPAAFTLFAVASILVSIAAVPIAMTKAQAPAPIGNVQIRPGPMFKASPVGSLGCLATGMVQGSFWSLGPVFAQQGGLDVAGVAIFMSVVVIAGALGQWPLGRLSDRMDRRKVILVACAGSAASAVGLAGFTGLVEGGLYIFAFLFGAFAFPLYALSIAHANDFVAPEDYIKAAGTLLLFYALGAVVGPLVASGVVETVGRAGLFGFTATVHLSLLAIALFRMTRRAPVPEEDRVDFADALVSTQTISPVEAAAPLFEAEEPEIDDEAEEPEYTDTGLRNR